MPKPRYNNTFLLRSDRFVMSLGPYDLWVGKSQMSGMPIVIVVWQEWWELLHPAERTLDRDIKKFDPEWRDAIRAFVKMETSHG